MDIDRFDFRINGEAVNYLVSKDGHSVKNRYNYNFIIMVGGGLKYSNYLMGCVEYSFTLCIAHST